MPGADYPFLDLLALSTMTIATVGPDGEPHAAPVYFSAGEDLALYFFSDPDSDHARDILQDSRAAASIFPECRGWQDIRGLQLRGTVRAVEAGEEWDSAWELYQKKFPFVAALKAVVARNALYAFIPLWVRWLDNQKGFGYKQEWTLA